MANGGTARNTNDMKRGSQQCHLEDVREKVGRKTTLQRLIRSLSLKKSSGQ